MIELIGNDYNARIGDIFTFWYIAKVSVNDRENLNKTMVITSKSSDDEIPTAKAVYNYINTLDSLTFNPSTGTLTATIFDGTSSKIKSNNVSSNSNHHVYFDNGENQVGYNSHLTFNPSTSILTINGITINGSTEVITATTFSGKATSAGSADTAAKATNIAVDANNSITLNVALLNVSAATTSTKPLVATTNKLSYNTSTGNLSALQLGVKSSGSDTTPKAYMKYNSTDECIEFIFA